MDDQSQTSGEYLEQLVGEGKKYSSMEELAKGYANADKFIEALKARTTDLEQEVSKRMAVEEFIKSKQTDGNQSQANESDSNSSGEPAPNQAEAKESEAEERKVDESELIERIKAELKQEDEKEVSKRNTEAVVSRLQEVYGSDEAVNKAIQEKAAEIGVSVQWLQDAAAKSPKAFFSLTGIDGGKPAPSGPSPAVNTAGLKPAAESANPQPGTKAYYDELRRKDLNKFMSREVQSQYMKDAMDNPDKFYGRN